MYLKLSQMIQDEDSLNLTLIARNEYSGWFKILVRCFSQVGG